MNTAWTNIIVNIMCEYWIKTILNVVLFVYRCGGEWPVQRNWSLMDIQHYVFGSKCNMSWQQWSKHWQESISLKICEDLPDPTCQVDSSNTWAEPVVVTSVSQEGCLKSCVHQWTEYTVNWSGHNYTDCQPVEATIGVHWVERYSVVNSATLTRLWWLWHAHDSTLG